MRDVQTLRSRLTLKELGRMYYDIGYDGHCMSTKDSGGVQFHYDIHYLRRMYSYRYVDINY